jgi:iron(III) transport system substrate-binding protein
MVKVHQPCELQRSQPALRQSHGVEPVLSSTSTLAIAALTASTLAIMPARAQTPAQTMAEIAGYQGADRMERLIAGAKKEGVVSVYGSSVLEDMKPISDAFKAKYGIDFQYWRASSENLPAVRPW